MHSEKYGTKRNKNKNFLLKKKNCFTLYPLEGFVWYLL